MSVRISYRNSEFIFIIPREISTGLHQEFLQGFLQEFFSYFCTGLLHEFLPKFLPVLYQGIFPGFLVKVCPGIAAVVHPDMNFLRCTFRESSLRFYPDFILGFHIYFILLHSSQRFLLGITPRDFPGISFKLHLGISAGRFT